MTGLYHSAKGTTWNNHKYTDKITKNGKTRYVYEQKTNEGRKVDKTELSEQMRKDMEELGLPKSVIDKVDEYTSSIEDFYSYMEGENIQSVDQLKTVFKDVITRSGSKYIESSDVDRLFNVAKKFADGNKLTKNDYLDIAEVSAKVNVKDLTKIGEQFKNEASIKKTRANIDQAIAKNKGKPVKVIYSTQPSHLPTDKVTFGKKCIGSSRKPAINFPI